MAAELGHLMLVLAAGFLLASLAMQSLWHLRLLACGAAVIGIAYGALMGPDPVWMVSVAALAVNVWRLVDVMRVRRSVRQAEAGGLSVEALLPYMLRLPRKRGTVLFERGDVADIAYYIAEGSVRIVEPARLLGPGDLIGEIAIFTPDRRRTATAVCEQDCVLYAITAKKITELCFQNPLFGVHVLRLITSRLLDTLTQSRPTGPGETPNH